MNIKSILGKSYNGVIKIPGDKSISIRIVLLSNFFNGNFDIKNINLGSDTKTAIKCMNELYKYTDSIEKKLSSNKKVQIKPLVLNCNNSGTTMRLLAGLLSSVYHCTNLQFILKGDKSLEKRPMNRVVTPLQKMGFDIFCNDNTAPIYINFKGKHKHIKSFSYISKISSAQVKSCLQIAAYFSNIRLEYKEPYTSRNHTEIMLKYLKNNEYDKYIIPGDISTASTFITNAIIQKILYGKESNLKMKNIGINNTRIGFIKALRKMGIKIEIKNIRYLQGEKTSDIYFNTKNLNEYKGIHINKKEVPSIIDELPLLILLSFFAKTNSSFNGIEELKNKESDRLKAMINLSDYLSKNNKKALSHLLKSTDHRILMILKILRINNIKNKSYLNISI